MRKPTWMRWAKWKRGPQPPSLLLPSPPSSSQISTSSAPEAVLTNSAPPSPRENVVSEVTGAAWPCSTASCAQGLAVLAGCQRHRRMALSPAPEASKSVPRSADENQRTQLMRAVWPRSVATIRAACQYEAWFVDRAVQLAGRHRPLDNSSCRPCLGIVEHHGIVGAIGYKAALPPVQAAGAAINAHSEVLQNYSRHSLYHRNCDHCVNALGSRGARELVN